MLHGIIGIICGLYALIWGWMNHEKHNLKNIMIAWTIAIVLGAVFNVASMP